MGIEIIYAGKIMRIAGNRLMGSKLFKPLVKIFYQAVFVIIDKYACGNVHCIHSAQAFFDPALFYQVLYLRGNIYVGAFSLGIKPEILGKRFHKDTKILQYEFNFRLKLNSAGDENRTHILFVLVPPLYYLL